jgi:phosphoribosylanthranilate isomerase
MRVKICGLKTEEAVSTAVSAGADYLGFIFFEKSPRNITPEQAALISKNVPANVKKVAVLVNPDNDLLQSIYEHLKLDYFQLHGEESATRTVAIRENFRTPIIKAIGIATKDDMKKAEEFIDVAEYLLLDAKQPKDAAMPGGMGKSFDWNVLAAKPTVPFFLSGGLTPENVAAAIRITKPFGVDVSSGVEASPGVKDLQKIRRFIENAKQQKI